MLRLMWAAFLGTLPIYGVAVVLAAPAGGGDPMLPFLLAAVALVEVTMLGVLRFIQLGPGLGLFAREDLRAEATGDDAAWAALSVAETRFQTGTIVAFALTEAIAILGFVSSFLSGQVAWYVGHAALAGLLLLAQLPTRSGLLGVVPPGPRKRLRDLDR